MKFNINSGYGRLIADRLAAGASGRVIIVGSSSVAERDTYQEIFAPDANGRIIFAATIDAAIGLCVANAGDTIYVLPEHAETVTATSIAHDVAGVSVIGLGYGESRPTLTFGVDTATITVSAANAHWSNFRFVANYADVASAFTLTTATGFTVDHSDFLDTSSILNFLTMVTTSATDNQSDGLSFLNNYVYGLASTSGAVVSILANELRLKVNDNIVDKAATNNAGQLVTLSSKIVGGAQILRNILTVVGASGTTVGILLTGSGSTSSGVVGFNNVWSLDTTGALLMTASTGLRPMQNYLSGAADKSGTLAPTADDAS